MKWATRMVVAMAVMVLATTSGRADDRTTSVTSSENGSVQPIPSPISGTDPDDLEERVQKLERLVIELGGEEELKRLIPTVDRRIQANSDGIKDIKEKDIARLDKDVGNVQGAIKDIATEDVNQHYPKVLANVATNDRFKDEWFRSVQGKLVVTNKTKTWKVFFINGGRWRIPPGKHAFWVPAGPVRAHLKNETPQTFKNWKPYKDPQSGKITHMRLLISIGPVASPF